MKIKKLTLQNIRSYESQTVEFPEGTILVHGENGAGKTSLLMGIFGGLFLSDITRAGNQSFNLDDLVRRGEDKAHVELVFEIDGADYTVEWTFYTTSTGPDATLRSPALSEPVSQVSNVKAKIQEILGMDKDDFSASVCVRQGEINRLIDADTRTELIDSLLNLDVIDEYITKMEGAKRGAGRIQRDNKRDRERAEQEIEEKYDRDEAQFEADINDLTEQIQDQESEKDEAEEFIDTLEDRRNDIEGKIESFEETLEKKQEKESQIEEAEGSRAENRRKKQQARDAIKDNRTEIEELEEGLSELDATVEYDLSTETAAEDAASTVQEEYTEAQQKRTRREGELDSVRNGLQDLESDLSDAKEELDTLESDLSEEEETLEQNREDLSHEEDDLQRRVKTRNKKAAEFLPDTSAEEVIDSTRDEVEARIEDLDDKREQADKELTRVRTELEQERKGLEEQTDELEETKDDHKSTREELESRRDALADLESEVEAAEEEFAAQIEELQSEGEGLGIDISPDALGRARDERIPERESELTAEIESVSESIAGLETREEQIQADIEGVLNLSDQDKCPKCGQDVDESHVEDEIEDYQDELAEVREELEAERERKAELESERSAFDDLLGDVRQAIDYRDNVLEEKRNQRDEKREHVADAEDRVEELESDIEDLEDQIADLKGEIESLKEDKSELSEQVENLEAEVNIGETVVALFDDVDEQREAVETLQEEIEDLTEAIDDTEDQIEDVQTSIEDLESKIAEQEETVEQKEAELEQAKQRVAEIKKIRSHVDEALDKYDAIEDLQNEIDRHEQTISHCDERIQDLNERIRTLEDEKEELEEELGDTDVAGLREDRDKLTERIEELEEKVADYEAEIQNLREQRTSLEKDLESVRELKADIERYERQYQWTEAVIREIDTMLAAYRSSKSELREQYLGYLREYTNEIFDEVYKNSSYQQVIIREVEERGELKYDLKLLRNDGDFEDPSNASGGERAIVNLALRAGIYRLIAELEGGDRAKLPPFILDEPTTFLDEGHVGQLEEMLNTIKRWDVPQVIVVSHEESLIHGADHKCEITIDEETNTSQVEMQAAGGEELAPGDD